MVALAESWGDDQTYFSAARERIANLERIMLDEHSEEQLRDVGWDSDSIREEFKDGYE